MSAKQLISIFVENKDDIKKTLKEIIEIGTDNIETFDYECMICLNIAFDPLECPKC